MTKLKNVEMGVFVLMAHLFITLALIGVYTYTLVSGIADETLKTVLTVIVGYWFGAVGKEAMMSNKKGVEMNEERQAESNKDKHVG